MLMAEIKNIRKKENNKYFSTIFGQTSIWLIASIIIAIPVNNKYGFSLNDKNVITPKNKKIKCLGFIKKLLIFCKIFIYNYNISIFFTTFAGLPTAIELGGISPTTTLPAPIIVFLPI